MRYYVTARSPEDKQELLMILPNIIDTEPGSLTNILVSTADVDQLLKDPRVADVQPHSSDWPGLIIEIPPFTNDH